MAAIVPAAGCGARTGLNQNKILASIAGQPLLSWTLRALLQAAPRLRNLGIELTQILIAAREEEFEILQPFLTPHSILHTPHSALIALIPGGATRQQSVGNAARKADTDFLLVHDAARPLVSIDLIERVVKSALQSGAAIAALPASDTIKIARENDGIAVVGSTPSRADVWHAQTPQIFQRALFLRALENANCENFVGTDCASLVERIGANVALVPGEIENFKVTFADDLLRAETILKARALTLENALN